MKARDRETSYLRVKSSPNGGTPVRRHVPAMEKKWDDWKAKKESQRTWDMQWKEAIAVNRC